MRTKGGGQSCQKVEVLEVLVLRTFGSVQLSEIISSSVLLTIECKIVRFEHTKF